MKALTIWQPYASLLVAQKQKRFETRGWATDYRGPIAIHAAMRPVRQTVECLPLDVRGRIKGLFPGLGELDQLPTGAIIGIGVLERCNAITEDFLAGLSPMEAALGDYSPGRFAWEFSGLHFIDPIPASRKQGLWNWEGN
ncbi:MAG: ASCH domain-containing protein [Roseburia sp.]|nr:ASCH domain-containing protein [Roseburia sp.]